MGKLTPEELKQLQDAIAWKANKGEDTSTLETIRDIGAAQASTDDKT